RDSVEHRRQEQHDSVEAPSTTCQHIQDRACAHGRANSAGGAETVGDHEQLATNVGVRPRTVRCRTVAMSAEMKEHPGAVDPAAERSGLVDRPGQAMREDGDGLARTCDDVVDALAIERYQWHVKRGALSATPGDTRRPTRG